MNYLEIYAGNLPGRDYYYVTPEFDKIERVAIEATALTISINRGRLCRNLEYASAECKYSSILIFNDYYYAEKFQRAKFREYTDDSNNLTLHRYKYRPGQQVYLIIENKVITRMVSEATSIIYADTRFVRYTFTFVGGGLIDKYGREEDDNMLEWYEECFVYETIEEANSKLQRSGTNG